ncbi:DNA mismatch repair protein [Tritrichomonas foetus]|uniref:DNA mismatch repair protein n=1 Tax=Tritrichomonas foetus TaxID=1144522 RepID=A0A1J4KMM6_9EUKA|nr:DNA mismatch repair protein [Tritrichomonas foetus]|eukprot:OHT12559.1 DNA mismatch repair protein [Tritrichomonas foetus]
MRFFNFICTLTSDHMEAPIIRPLDPDVVKKIACGEVINEPINAVKELMENSIDAGADSITVRIINGGYTSIKIEDDGCGIRHSDLPAACRRHTTSKIKEYSDLTTINTFGFRGEALASMSCCSHLSIISRTENDTQGYCAHYLDCELNGSIEPISAIKGTIIEMRDIFYNNPIRLQERPKSNVEAKKISDMITKYSVVYPHIAFAFYSNDKELYKSYGNSTFDVVLRQIYTCEDPDAFFQLNFDVDNNTRAEIFLSTPGNSKAPKYSAIFINGRLISNDRIKHGIENVYIDVLPRGCKPFFFCVLTMPSEIVDVNFHPTKKEVKFLGESKIIEEICVNVKQALTERANQRGVEILKTKEPKKSQKYNIPENQQVFSFPDGKLQMLSQKPKDKNNEKENNNIENNQEEINNKTSVVDDDPIDDTPFSDSDHANSHANDSINDSGVNHQNEFENETSYSKPKVTPVTFEEERPRFLSNNSSDDDLITTDSVSSRLFSVSCDIPPKPKKKKTKENVGIFDDLKYDPIVTCKKPIDRSLQTLEQVLTQPQVSVPKPFRVVDLTSILSMKAEVINSCDFDLAQALKNHEFVGFIGLRLILLQVDSELYAFNLYALLKDFFYQRVLNYFANYSKQFMNPPISIEKSIHIISNDPYQFDFEPHQTMLEDYFNMSIKDNLLHSLPQPLSGYTPSFTTLPLFLYQITHDVDWEDEYECFSGLFDALSSLYSVNPEDEEDEELTKKLQNEITNTILPLLKTDEYKPSTSLKNDVSICALPFNYDDE